VRSAKADEAPEGGASCACRARRLASTSLRQYDARIHITLLPDDAMPAQIDLRKQRGVGIEAVEDHGSDVVVPELARRFEAVWGEGFAPSLADLRPCTSPR
jgi:hypothetical protein